MIAHPTVGLDSHRVLPGGHPEQAFVKLAVFRVEKDVRAAGPSGREDEELGAPTRESFEMLEPLCLHVRFLEECRVERLRSHSVGFGSLTAVLDLSWSGEH